MLLCAIGLMGFAPRTPAPRACLDAAVPSVSILAEEPNWLVAVKPPGINIHEGDDCLVAALGAAGKQGLHPVHRLDRETSGVVLLAKNPVAAASLQAALQGNGVVKRYRGVLVGVPKKRRGRWSATISGKGEGRRNPRGIASSRVDAATDWVVVGDNNFVSCCEFTIAKGGRTHQIRKHAAVAGTPMFGDARYGDKKRNAQLNARYGFDGMALHAALLRLEIDGVS